jgi:hypothetical protein
MKISNLITNENTEEEDFPSYTKNYLLKYRGIHALPPSGFELVTSSEETHILSH